MLINKIKKLMKLHFENNFILYFTIICIFIIGSIIGPIIFKLGFNNLNYLLSKVLIPYTKDLNNNYINIFDTFKIKLLSNTILIIIIFILSLMKSGLYIIPLLILWKGISFSYLVAFLVYYHKISGVITAIFSVFIPNVFIIYSIIGLSTLAMSISQLSRNASNLNRNNLKTLIVRGSLIQFILYFFITIIGTLFESLTYNSILKLIM